MKFDLSKDLTRGTKRTLDDFRCEMFSLLEEKSFEKIVVGEICSRASYPRATFYNYFDDKYDLLNYCWIYLSSEIGLDEYHYAPHKEMLYLFFNRIFDFTDRHISEIRKVLSNNTETNYMFGSFESYMKAQMCRIFEDCPDAESTPLPKKLLADHYSNTILLVWEWCYLIKPESTRNDAVEYLRFLVGSLG